MELGDTRGSPSSRRSAALSDDQPSVTPHGVPPFEVTDLTGIWPDLTSGTPVPTPSTPASLFGLLVHDDASVRRKALQAIALLPRVDIAAGALSVVACFDRDDDMGVHRAAHDVLEKLSAEDLHRIAPQIIASSYGLTVASGIVLDACAQFAPLLVERLDSNEPSRVLRVLCHVEQSAMHIDGQVAPLIVQRLRSERRDTRLAALRALAKPCGSFGKMGLTLLDDAAASKYQDAVSALVECLTDMHADIRKAALWRIQELFSSSEMARHATSVARLLEDPDITVRDSAAQAMQLLPHTALAQLEPAPTSAQLEGVCFSEHTEFLLDGLRRAQNAGDKLDKLNAIGDLGRMERGVLSECILDVKPFLADGDSEVREAAINVFRRIKLGTFVAHANLVADRLEDGAAEVRQSARRLLTERLKPESLDELMTPRLTVLLSHANANVRAFALQTLTHLEAQALGKHQDAIKAHLRDVAPTVRIAAVSMLGKLRELNIDLVQFTVEERVKELMVMIEDEDCAVRTCVAAQLNEIRGRNREIFEEIFEPYLGGILDKLKCPDATRREAAMACIAQLRPQKLVGDPTPILSLLSDSDASVRCRCVIALRNLGTGLEHILPLLGDADARVRAEVLHTMYLTLPGERDLLVTKMPQLVRLLEDADTSLRQRAFRAMCEFDAESREPFVADISKGLLDEDPRVISLAFRALTVLPSHAIKPHLLLMIQHLGHAKKGVRDAAVNALSGMPDALLSEVFTVAVVKEQFGCAGSATRAACARVMSCLPNSALRAHADAFLEEWARDRDAQLCEASMSALSLLEPGDLVKYTPLLISYCEEMRKGYQMGDAFSKLEPSVQKQTIATIVQKLDSACTRARSELLRVLDSLSSQALTHYCNDIAKWINADHWLVRGAALQTLSGIRRKELKTFIPQMEKCLKDRPYVHMQALSALGRLDPKAIASRTTAITPKLSQDNEDVRAAAARALGRLESKQLAGFLPAIVQDLSEDDGSSLLQRLRLLGKIAKVEPQNVQGYASIIANHLHNRRASVREQVLNILALFDPEQPDMQAMMVPLALQRLFHDEDLSVRIAAKEMLSRYDVSVLERALRIRVRAVTERQDEKMTTRVDSSSDIRKQRSRTRMLKSLSFVVPIAIINFMDYASDVLVVYQLCSHGFVEGWLGAAACGLSIMVPLVCCIVLVCYLLCSSEAREGFRFSMCGMGIRQVVTLGLLTPFNLHVLYAGLLYTAASEDATQLGAENLKILLHVLKALETAFESVLLSMLTLIAVLRDLSGEDVPLLASSAVISIFSVTYGYYGVSEAMIRKNRIRQATNEAVRRRDSMAALGLMVKGGAFSEGRAELFFGILIHVVWFMLSCACLIAATPYGYAGLGGIYLIAVFQFLITMLDGSSGCELLKLALQNLVQALIFSIIPLVFDFPDPKTACGGEDRVQFGPLRFTLEPVTRPMFHRCGFLLRRIAFFGMAFTGLIMRPNAELLLIVLLIVLGTLDTIVSVRCAAAAGWFDKCRRTLKKKASLKKLQRNHISPSPTVVSPEQKTRRASTMQRLPLKARDHHLRAAALDAAPPYLYELDLVDGIIALRESSPAAGQLADFCKEVVRGYLPSMTVTMRRELVSAIKPYSPWKPGETESLLHLLQSLCGQHAPGRDQQDTASLLLRRLDSEVESDTDVRAAALRALGRLEPAALAAHAPRIVKLLEDPDNAVRTAAVETLGRLKPATCAELAEQILARLADESAGVRAAAVDVLRRLKPASLHSMRGKIVAFLEAAETGTRAAAVQLLGESISTSTFYEHPMRAATLANVLDASLWLGVSFTHSDSERKRRLDAANWSMSRTVNSCDWFVSHAWEDEQRHPGKKVSMLRKYLCLQYLLAKVFVVFGLIALYLIPFGLGIHSIADWFVWWAPAAGITAIPLLVWSWTGLSVCGIVPSRLAPWAFSPLTLWLDKCCVCQESEETIEAGVCSFERFLGSCHGMIAFVSPKYFSRLWCVYELATFCRMHRVAQASVEELDEKLLLLSLDWASTINPFRSSTLTEEERAWFRDFCCLDVLCSKPADRAFVLHEIRTHWRTEAAFDQFVHRELPAILETSKRNYSNQLLRVTSSALEAQFHG